MGKKSLFNINFNVFFFPKNILKLFFNILRCSFSFTLATVLYCLSILSFSTIVNVILGDQTVRHKHGDHVAVILSGVFDRLDADYPPASSLRRRAEQLLTPAHDLHEFCALSRCLEERGGRRLRINCVGGAEPQDLSGLRLHRKTPPPNRRWRQRASPVASS